MAYVSKELAQKIRQELKEKFPTSKGWKFSVKKDHESLYCKIIQAPINLGEDIDRVEKDGYANINEYHLHNYKHEKLFAKIIDILNGKFLPSENQNYDNSDPMTDYFCVGWYINLSLGSWDKPFFYPTLKDKMELV